MQIARFSRGQTVIEFVVAMPIVLLGLFAIIYFARFGVVSERSELALRYGGIVEFNDGGNVYSAANIYYNLNGQRPPCPTPPVTIVNGAGPFPGATSAPFWQADSDVAAPSSSCTADASGFGGSQFIASHFWATTQVNVNANVDVPPYLQPALGASSGNADTTLTFVHAAFPGIILWCSTEVRYRVNASLTNGGSSTLPTPMPDGTDTSTPAPNNNGHCD
jgi:hypothetical protein